jgi:nucleoside phosphorylase
MKALQADQLRGQVDVGIITVRQDEADAVTRRLEPQDTVRGRRWYDMAWCADRRGARYRTVHVRCPSEGHRDAQTVAEELINDLEPAWILLVGICGSVPSDEFTLGDVIIASGVGDFALQAWKEENRKEFHLQGGRVHRQVEEILGLPTLWRHLADWNSHKTIGRDPPNIAIPPDHSSPLLYGSEDWRDRVIEALERHWARGDPVSRRPLAFAGPIGTGNTLVKDTSFMTGLLEYFRKLAAIEMELGGVLAAARQSNREYPVLCVRGISDIVGLKRDPQWTAYACETAAACCLGLIRSGLLGDPRSGVSRHASPPPDLLPRPALRIANWPALATAPSAGATFPCNLAVRWGLDRGGFIGVVGGAPELRLIDALMTAELELQRVLRHGVEGVALPIRVWLDVPEGVSTSTIYQVTSDVLRDAPHTKDERLPRLLEAFQAHAAIPGFTVTRRIDGITADELVGTIEELHQMSASDDAVDAAFCLELVGDQHDATTLIDHATTRLRDRGITIDAFGWTAASAQTAPGSALARLVGGLKGPELLEEPSLLGRLRRASRSGSSLASRERLLIEELAGAGPDDLQRAVQFVRNRHPGLASDFTSVLARSEVETTRLAALAAVADADRLLDAWLEGVGDEFDKIPGPTQLVQISTNVSLRINLVCAMMRHRRYLSQAGESFDVSMDRLLADADPELVAVVEAIRSGDVQRPEFFDQDTGSERLSLLRRCMPDLAVPIDELTPTARNRRGVWRLVQSVDLRAELLTRLLRLGPSARAVLGLCSADERARIHGTQRWRELLELRRW